MKKRFSGLIALAMATALFSGCVPNVDYLAGTSSNTASGESGAQSASGVTLKVWSSQMDQETTKSLSEEFNQKKNTINYVLMAENDAAAELLRDPAAGADVFAVTADRIGELAAAGVLLPVSNADDVRSANTAASVQAATVGDQLYAYPASVNTIFLYYNKSKLTAEDVQSIESILAKDASAATNLAMNFQNGYFTAPFFFANGCTLDNWSTDTALAAGKALLRVASDAKVKSMKDDDIVSGFRDGTLAAAISGAWNAEAIYGALGENYACAKLPTVNIGGADKQLVSFGNIKLFGVNANSQHPEEAQALANWLASADGQRTWLESNGLAPTNLSLLEDQALMAPAPSSEEDKNQKAARIARESQSAIAAQGAFVVVQPSDASMKAVWAAFAAFGQELDEKSINDANLGGRLDQLAAECTSGNAE